MDNAQEVINKLENDSVWFKALKPQYKLFVAEYCSNGFDGKLAAKAVGGKLNPNTTLALEAVQKAKQEFVEVALADTVGKLETRVIDVLSKRAFYNPLMFIDSKGQPKTADGKEFRADNFDEAEYIERLGDWAVCIEGIKMAMHPKNADTVAVTVMLADRNQALKQLSAYANLAREGDVDKPSSFVVNVNIKDRENREIVAEVEEEK